MSQFAWKQIWGGDFEKLKVIVKNEEVKLCQQIK